MISPKRISLPLSWKQEKFGFIFTLISPEASSHRYLAISIHLKKAEFTGTRTHLMPQPLHEKVAKIYMAPHMRFKFSLFNFKVRTFFPMIQYFPHLAIFRNRPEDLLKI